VDVVGFWGATRNRAKVWTRFLALDL
jgi:hypothetical protein